MTSREIEPARQLAVVLHQTQQPVYTDWVNIARHTVGSDPSPSPSLLYIHVCTYTIITFLIQHLYDKYYNGCFEVLDFQI